MGQAVLGAGTVIRLRFSPVLRPLLTGRQLPGCLRDEIKIALLVYS
ncbi:hypothetical protein [Deinococcus multiflagellatus]|uniref:Uncharacterized protein n=1 Tax=Deinococcus multiflagellatus TaxID=1656887 RepID=A0ABW1ZPX1_9DEIO